MRKVFSSDQKYLYRTTFDERLYLLVICVYVLFLIDLLAFGFEHTPENMKRLFYLGCCFFIISILAGLYNQSIEFNFAARTLRFKSGWAKYHSRDITLGFSSIKSLKLISTSIYIPGPLYTRNMWWLILEADGDVPAKILLGSPTFNHKEASAEADALARKIPIQVENVFK